MSHQKEITYRNPIVIDRDWRKLKVSVIVPVYNVKPYLNRCVKTLLAQTLDNIEIILVDDCSTDGSGEVIKQLVIKHPDVVKAVFLEINSKQGAARNEGIKIARGEYISFVDSDDWVSTDMLKLLYEKAKETGADLVDCDYVSHDGNKILRKYKSMTYQLHSGEIDRDKLLFNFGRLWAKIFKREVFFSNEKPITFIEGIFYEDNYVLPFLVDRTTSVAKIELPLYFYFDNSASTTRKKMISECLIGCYRQIK